MYYVSEVVRRKADSKKTTTVRENELQTELHTTESSRPIRRTVTRAIGYPVADHLQKSAFRIRFIYKVRDKKKAHPKKGS